MIRIFGLFSAFLLLAAMAPPNDCSGQPGVTNVLGRADAGAAGPTDGGLGENGAGFDCPLLGVAVASTGMVLDLVASPPSLTFGPNRYPGSIVLIRDSALPQVTSFKSDATTLVSTFDPLLHRTVTTEPPTFRATVSYRARMPGQPTFTFASILVAEQLSSGGIKALRYPLPGAGHWAAFNGGMIWTDGVTAFQFARCH